jgi:hypothetical protein
VALFFPEPSGKAIYGAWRPLNIHKDAKTITRSFEDVESKDGNDLNAVVSLRASRIPQWMLTTESSSTIKQQYYLILKDSITC